MKAFPILNYLSGTNGYKYSDEGMDLRDYFAARAMQSFIIKSQLGVFNRIYAIQAYEMADAMMKAREND